jgi:hypothetical protein
MMAAPIIRIMGRIVDKSGIKAGVVAVCSSLFEDMLKVLLCLL